MFLISAAVSCQKLQTYCATHQPSLFNEDQAEIFEDFSIYQRWPGEIRDILDYPGARITKKIDNNMFNCMEKAANNYFGKIRYKFVC